MTRREFLQGLGATAGASACGNANKRAKPVEPTPAGNTSPSPIEESPVPRQGAQSPLLFHGGRLLVATGEAIRVHEASSLAGLGSIPLATSNICALSAGTVAALVPPAPGSVAGAVHRIDLATNASARFSGTITGSGGFTLLAAPAGEVYVAADSWAVRFALRPPNQLQRVGRLTLPRRPSLDRRSRSEQIVTIAGQLVIPAAGALHLLGPGVDRPLRTAELAPVHVAAASDGRVWYSTFHEHRLVLAGLEDPVRVDRRVDLGAAIIHIGSAGETVAAVVCDDTAEPRWEIVLANEVSGLRWRAPLPAALADREVPPFVAVSGERVVAWSERSPDPLFSWDAATGEPRSAR